MSVSVPRSSTDQHEQEWIRRLKQLVPMIQYVLYAVSWAFTSGLLDWTFMRS